MLETDEFILTPVERGVELEHESIDLVKLDSKDYEIEK